MRAVDLSPVTYEYGTLPGTKAEAENTEAQQLLESTARMATAVAANSDDAMRWNELGGLSLFWQGVLINDKDSAKAVPVLKAGADLLRTVSDAGPDDREARFRLAEALRWVGLAEPSNNDTADTEREAVRQYELLWKDRASIDVGFLQKIGAGYGYALANLAQTIRETELANLSDGRTAEDHVGWVFEVLALAAEKDDVNASLIAAGATSRATSTFVGGWYRMSSYGWPLGFLSGQVHVEAGQEPVTECDLLAADPYDPLKRAPGLVLDRVNVPKAETACRADAESHPEDARMTYQLARVISSDSKREAEFMPLARAAAEQGVSPAFSLIGSALNDRNDDRSGDAYAGASQRTIIESFPVLYSFLKSHARTDRDRLGLAWYVGKAAALGVADAHLALADDAPDLKQRLFHLLLAARIFDASGSIEAAADARRQADGVLVRQPDQERIQSDVSDWKPEALIELPAEKPGAS